MDSLIFEEHELRLNSFDTASKLEDYELFKSNYDSLKAKLNEVYLKQKQIENAIKLSEQYVDFHTLVYVCELKSDADLLESYLDRYANMVFVLFIFFYFSLT
jgi:nuclear pore complex protein Nup133